MRLPAAGSLGSSLRLPEFKEISPHADENQHQARLSWEQVAYLHHAHLRAKDFWTSLPRTCQLFLLISVMQAMLAGGFAAAQFSRVRHSMQTGLHTQPHHTTSLLLLGARSRAS